MVGDACEVDDLITTERVAVVVRLLMLGRRMTTREVADATGLRLRGAERMLDKISRVTPLAKEGRHWVMYVQGCELP